jgi:O-antigen/teichoic acid export membrane protein
MVGRFFRDSALYGVATVLAKGLTVLLVPVYTAYMSRGEIGLLDLLLGAMAVLTLLVGLDMSNGLAREYADTRDAELRCRYSSTCLWFTAVVFGMAAMVGWLGAEPLARRFLGGVPGVGAVRAAAVSMAVGGVYVVAVQQLRWMLRPGRFGLVSVATTALSLLVTVLLTGRYGMGAAGVLYGMAAGSALGVGFTLLAAGGEFGFRFDWGCLRRMLRFCVPIVPSSLAVIVNQYISRYVIEWEMGREAVGLFGVGTRLAGLAGLVMLGFGSALTPLVYARQDDPETPGQLARIFRIFVSLAVVGTAGLSLFAAEVVRVLTRADYGSVVPLLVWLSPAFLLIQMYIFAPGAWIRRRMWWVAGTNVLIAVVALLLNWLLVPRFGLTGAAAATLLAALLHFVLSMLVSQAMYPVPHEWGRVAAVVLAGLVVTVAGAWLPGAISPALVMGKAVLLGALALVLLWTGEMEREWFRSRVLSRLRRA